MFNLVKSEIDRIVNNKKYIILMIVSLVLYILVGFFVLMGGLGFYDPLTTMPLNSLNLSVFIIRDYHLYLLFIFCPMIFIESFNSDFVSGRYRLILLRGNNKFKYIVSKIITCGIILGVFMLVILVIGIALGMIFGKSVTATSFFNINGQLSLFESIVYSIKVYLLEFLILISFMAITTVIGGVASNSVIAYLLSIGISVGGIYISDVFEFFLSNTKSIFDTLAGLNNTFIPICIIIILIGYIVTITTFKRKDYY